MQSVNRSKSWLGIRVSFGDEKGVTVDQRVNVRRAYVSVMTEVIAREWMRQMAGNRSVENALFGWALDEMSDEELIKALRRSLICTGLELSREQRRHAREAAALRAKESGSSDDDCSYAEGA